MIRTQVQLTQEQSRKLRKLAREENVSVAEIVRRSVERHLREANSDRVHLYARAWELVGSLGDEDKTRDLAAEHDRYLDEAFE